MSSAALSTLAARLGHSKEQLDYNTYSIMQAWTTALSPHQGLGFTSALALAHGYSQGFKDVSTTLKNISTILETAAELERPVEQARFFALSLWSISPAASMILHQLHTMTAVLDLYCAQYISELCTPAAPPPRRRFSDSSQLSAEEIHHLNLAHAPDHVRTLVTNNPDVTLLEVGDNTMVLALGDIDSAESITTLVAGVGSSDPQSWERQLTRLRHIHAGPNTASVLWLGYQAPSSLAHGAAAHAAKTAAPQLSEFQATLAHRSPAQRRVVVGYSYGSVVAGTAATQSPGLSTDAVVFVGSPGIPAHHAQDLGIPEVYAVTGTRDDIAWTSGWASGIHGISPASPFFGAQLWPSHSDHSSYFEDPDFQDRLKKVTTGDSS
ncbi:hypothetical protein GP475_11160 [Corynebacterium poyangense]|uniref:DUF1023 domain-containing protein n=1 Tax=Corynebacterium poyangense TaxID=2684405 RepID=A0A7H0SRF3_9CORY|nr:alpha/beta hydrolase [Corynebacterium poyangense]MBZ8176563.1 hypothetical protein [Corynebacterium poyangense]QNQ91128.1 hypothetical protein GP475_11160 [Corynebacterium poyangense]